MKQEIIPKKGHTEVIDEEVEATCTKTGLTEGKHCSACGVVLVAQKEILAKGHTYGNWIQTKEADAINKGEKIRICTTCGQKEVQNSASLNPYIKLNAKTLPLQLKKSTNVLKVVGMQKGDSVLSYKSSKPKVVSVNARTGKMTAKKTGTAIITVTLRSGVKATCTVKVQKAKVTTKSIKLETKKLTLKRGKKAKLSITLNPLTSTDKMKFASSNKKVATVTSKGVVTAKKKGTAKIVIQSGKKKVICKVTVK